MKLVTLINFTQPVNGYKTYKDTFIFIALLLTYFSL